MQRTCNKIKLSWLTHSFITRKKWDFTGVQSHDEKYLNLFLPTPPGYQLAHSAQITSACLYVGILSEMSNADLESRTTTKNQWLEITMILRQMAV